MRDFGLIVNDIPLLRIQPRERTIWHHSIVDGGSNLHIPLQYDKPLSFFFCRKPTSNEVTDSVNCIHVRMTSEREWVPYDEQAKVDEDMIRESLMNKNETLLFPNRRLEALLLRYDTESSLVALGVRVDY